VKVGELARFLTEHLPDMEVVAFDGDDPHPTDMRITQAECAPDWKGVDRVALTFSRFLDEPHKGKRYRLAVENDIIMSTFATPIDAIEAGRRHADLLTKHGVKGPFRIRWTSFDPKPPGIGSNAVPPIFDAESGEEVYP